MYKVKIKYDEAEVLSHIVNVLTPPFSLVHVSRNLGIPRIRVSRIIKRIQEKWWITATLDIRRICRKKIIVLTKTLPDENISNKAIFIGKTIEDKFVLTFLIPSIIDPYEFIDRIDNVVSYYVFDKTFYNRPLFEKYFANGYLEVDLKTILLDVIDKLNKGSLNRLDRDYNLPDVSHTGCIPLGVTDKRIIDKLLCNGLLSGRALARTLNTTQNKINKRIKFLVRAGVLQGFTVGYTKINDMGEQLFWIVFIIKFNNNDEALYFIKNLVHTPFIGHIDYDSRNAMVKLILRVYRDNIGYVYDIAKIIGEKLNVIDTMIVSTKSAVFRLNNMLSNHLFHVKIS